MSQNNQKSSLSQVLSEYLDRTRAKQIDVAEYLSVSERTLRRWKNGEVILSDVRELKRIAELLDVPPERLGVSDAPLPFTAEEIDSSMDHIWKMVRVARYHDASVLLNRLLTNITELVQTEDRRLLSKLANTQHIAGFVKSQITHANQAFMPLKHYKEMENLARILEDNELLMIALTYEGDMLQRGGNVKEAIDYLEEAKNVPASVNARGNAVQLLGRAYFKAQRLADFERSMKESEQLAFEAVLDSTTNAVRGQFNVGTVYEEYGRSLGLLGNLNQGMDYLQKAENVFNQNWNVQRRNVLITTAKAMVLVHGGEIQEGVNVAVDAVQLCRQAGNIRLLDRIYGLQRYLDHLSRQIGSAGSVLRDALDGPIEY